MPNIKKHPCTEHRIRLCHENKAIVLQKKAGIKRQTSISDVVNEIIEEWNYLANNDLVLRMNLLK